MIIEKVYNGRDNNIDLLLKDDTSGSLAPSDISATTRAKLVFPDITLDSDIAGQDTYFDWDTNGASGILGLSLGGAGLTCGSYEADIILYSATYTNGINWGSIIIEVED